MAPWAALRRQNCRTHGQKAREDYPSCATQIPKAHGGFEDQNRGANLDKPAGNVPEHRNTEKTNCSGAGGDGHPFHSEEKPIGCVICQTEGEIANEAAHGEQQYPSRPLDRFRIDHAIHDEKKP